MIVYLVAAIVATVFGIVLLIHRRQRSRPQTYQVVMAEYLWQPRKYR